MTLTQAQNSKLSLQTHRQSKLAHVYFCGWTVNAVHFQTSIVWILSASAEHLTDASEFLIAH